MGASSNLPFKNISQFGHSPSYNGAFRAHTRTPNAQQRGVATKPAVAGLCTTFWPLHARGAASAYPLLSSSLFHLTRLHLESLFPRLNGRKLVRRRRTRAPGRRVRRVHAARPMRRRVSVLIALLLVLILLLVLLLAPALPPPTPPHRPCFAFATCSCCRLPPPRSALPAASSAAASAAAASAAATSVASAAATERAVKVSARLIERASDTRSRSCASQHSRKRSPGSAS